jgi:NADPH:quinone reductase-like Zn-dependent oxidoreductase
MHEQAPAAAGGGESAGMRAAVFRTFGPPGVLRLEHDFPKPVRRQGQGQVLLRVAAAGVNPIDWKTRKGDVPRFAVTRPKVRVVLCRTTHAHTHTHTHRYTHTHTHAPHSPQIPGGDVAGVVLESDPGSQFTPGQRVFGCTGQQIFWSTYGTT